MRQGASKIACYKTGGGTITCRIRILHTCGLCRSLEPIRKVIGLRLPSSHFAPEGPVFNGSALQPRAEP